MKRNTFLKTSLMTLGASVVGLPVMGEDLSYLKIDETLEGKVLILGFIQKEEFYAMAVAEEFADIEPIYRTCIFRFINAAERVYKVNSFELVFEKLPENLINNLNKGGCFSYNIQASLVKKNCYTFSFKAKEKEPSSLQFQLDDGSTKQIYGI